MASVHDGHRERLRLRIESEGISNFQQHELLEFLLYYAAARGDMNPVAHELIDRFGSINGVLRAEEDELRKVRGVGVRTAAWLKRVEALMQTYAALDTEDRPFLNSYGQVSAFVKSHFAGIKGESVWQMCMGRNGRLLLVTRVSDGGDWGESGALREALTEALGVSAHSAVLLQLTGTRPPEPEDYDVDHTLAYAQTLMAAGVFLLDHVLMGADGLYSMTRDGKLIALPQPGEESRVLMERYFSEADA